MKKEKGQGQNTSKQRFLREREKKDDSKVKNAKGRIREVGKKTEVCTVITINLKEGS